MLTGTDFATTGARRGIVTTPSDGAVEVELYQGPLDGSHLMLALNSDGRPPDVHAFPCPGGRGDMLYRRSDLPVSSGRLRYEWTGERAPG